MDELKNIQTDTTLIPEGCLSFVEESTYIVSAIDEEFLELMEKCGAGSEAEETTDAEEVTDESTVITEKSLADIKDAVVGALKKAWEKIKAMFDHVVTWIKDRVKEAKNKKLDKIIADANRAKLKSDAELGKFHNGNVGEVSWMSKCASQYGDPNEIPSSVLYSIKKGTAGKTATMSDLKAGLKEYLLGEEVAVSGADFGSKSDALVKILRGSQLDDVKKAYNAARKTVDALIKQVKEEKKEPDKNIDSSSYNNRITCLRRCAQVLSQGIGVQLDAIRTQNREVFAIVMKVARMARKQDKATNESVAVDVFAW